MKFEEFLRVLGLDRKLDLAEATKTGACSIQFDNKITISIENDEKRCSSHAYCVIGKAPLKQRDALFAMFLQAHMFGIATDGCSFGFQPQSNQIILFTSINMAVIDNQMVIQQLESLVNQSIRWSNYLPELLENWEEKIAHAALSFDVGKW